jgi:hypothetical protein
VGMIAHDDIRRLPQLEPSRVLFAHDLAVWEAEPDLGPVRKRAAARPPER